MSLRVALYAPDRHLTYDGTTVDAVGVGGGVTARIRLATSLARLGCEVEVVCNCERDVVVNGVRYRRLDSVSELRTDLLIVSSSGGALDVSPISRVKVETQLTILMIAGHPRIKGLEEVHFDYICGPSNYITRAVGSEWGIEPSQRVVFYNGVVEEYFLGRRLSRPPRRDPFRLVYSSHPSKGLEAAMGVLERLRRRDRRFALHIYGGSRLWGDEDRPVEAEGVVYHGLLGQQRLALELQASSFSLCLQEIREAFGIGVMEAMKAGSIVVASAVGAFNETVRNGHNGFLISGSHLSGDVQDAAAELILELTQRPRWMERIRRVGYCEPFSWGTIASAWLGFAEWVVAGKPEESAYLPRCPGCGGYVLALADGYHCTGCGDFRKDLGGPITGDDASR